MVQDSLQHQTVNFHTASDRECLVQIFVQLTAFDKPFGSVPKDELAFIAIGHRPQFIDTDPRVSRRFLQGQITLLPNRNFFHLHLQFLVTECRGRKCQLSAPNAPDEVQISEYFSCVRGCAVGLFCACSARKRLSSCRTESRAFSLTCSLPFCRTSGFRSFSCKWAAVVCMVLKNLSSTVSKRCAAYSLVAFGALRSGENAAAKLLDLPPFCAR